MAREILKSSWKPEKHNPFDPVSKCITTETPKAILNLTNCSKEIATYFKAKTTDFARRGFRSFGVEMKKDDEEWTLRGTMPMFDLPRPDTAQTCFGWISGPGNLSDPMDLASLSANDHVNFVAVAVTWCYSIGVNIIIAIVYFLLNEIAWLDNLGWKHRSKGDTKIENIIGHLSKLALEHERDEAGVDCYHLVAKAMDAEGDY